MARHATLEEGPESWLKLSCSGTPTGLPGAKMHVWESLQQPAMPMRPQQRNCFARLPAGMYSKNKCVLMHTIHCMKRDALHIENHMRVCCTKVIPLHSTEAGLEENLFDVCYSASHLFHPAGLLARGLPQWLC